MRAAVVVRPIWERTFFAELPLAAPAQVHLSSLKRKEVNEPARLVVGRDLPQFLQIWLWSAADWAPLILCLVVAEPVLLLSLWHWQ